MTEHVALPLGDHWVAFVDASDYEWLIDAGRWYHRLGHKGVRRAQLHPEWTR
jgi:hypothetical protein